MIYEYAFAMRDQRSSRDRRIERRGVKRFTPTPAMILLVARYQYLVLSRAVALEALEVLFKRHTVLFSCGPLVLKTFLSKIEKERSGQGKKWLKWLKHIELDWTQFLSIRAYLLLRGSHQRQGNVENLREHMVSLDEPGERGGPDQHDMSDYFDEFDCESGLYNDNLYSIDDPTLHSIIPDYEESGEVLDEIFGEPIDEGPHMHVAFDAELGEGKLREGLRWLFKLEILPLFEYLCSPSFALSSLTVPLHFVRRGRYSQRGTSPSKMAKPLYYIQMAICALTMLLSDRADGSPCLNKVIIKYIPLDLWIYIECLQSGEYERLQKEGVFFDRNNEHLRWNDGEAMQAVWEGLARRGLTTPRDYLKASVTRVQGEEGEGGSENLEIVDHLEIVFTRL